MESKRWHPDGEAALAFCKAAKGTPYGGNRREPGRAIDCVNLVAGAMVAAGISKQIDLHPHPMTIGRGIHRNPMADAIATVYHAERILPDHWEPEPVDIVIFGVGRWAFHCAVIAGGRLWHVTHSMPVHDCAIISHRRRFQEILRITQPGEKQDPRTINLA